LDLQAVKSEVPEDPIARGLISVDLTAQTMLVWLADSSDLLNKPQSGIRQRIEAILHKHGLGQEGIYSAGTLIIQDWMFVEVIRAFIVVLPLVALIICVFVQWIFHRLSYVLLTLVIASTAIVWSLGATAFIFGEITLLVIATPALIVVISTADTIHLISAYVTELRHGLPSDQAARKVFRQVGGACVLTSATTFVGFLSLMVVPATTLRHMALACAIGVASALLLALTLVPMALTVLKPPPVAYGQPSRLNRWLAAGLDVCRRCSLSYPRSVVAAHAAIMLAAALAALGLEHDADLPARFPRSHPLRQSIDFFNNEMFGTSTIEVIVRTEPEDLLSSETVAAIAELDRRLRELPEVRDVSSIVSLFRLVDRFIGLDTPSGLPETTASATACVGLAEGINVGAANSIIARDAGLTRVAVQVAPTRVLKVLEFGERIKGVAEQCLPPGAEVELSGYYPVVGNAVREIIKSQVRGFAICFFCVMAVVTIGIRSVRLGLLAVLPNLFPLVLLGGILALTFDVVDSDLIGVAIVSFGLAVDDTIHFLHRYDIEAANAPNRALALGQTFQYTGSAIVRTTVILGFGLMPFALSDYFSIWILGTYLVFVLVCAVLGDLLLLPALIFLFGKDGSGRP
jgi:predicted RND superfamily exporter protein